MASTLVSPPQSSLKSYIRVIFCLMIGLGMLSCHPASGWPATSRVTPDQATPLDKYVATPDPAYKYSQVNKSEKPECTTIAYDMISQTWLDKKKVDHPVWEHTVLISVPKNLAFTKAMMFIGGGGNDKDMTKVSADNGPMEQIAILTKSIVVQIKQIPNQPLHFLDEDNPDFKEKGRKEDELITFGWDKFLKNGDPIWLARLPMTKAVVRAMDLAQKEFPKIDGFFVAGGSKRGWTTWTVAAVDNRVFGISPAVIDVLNLEASLTNHHDAYGFWAPAVGDYVERKIVDRIHTPEFKKLMAIVDPYSYRDRLTMPKYVLNGAGDQFFPPDSWKFYFDGLKDPKYICYIANTDHGLNEGAYFQLATFYQALLAGTPLPKFTWEKTPDGSLRVKCDTKPDKVLLWKAHNPAARDFRLETLGKKYESSVLTESEPGVYVSNGSPAATGWTAFFIELEFPNPGFQLPFKFSTGISILPDTYPGKK